MALTETRPETDRVDTVVDERQSATQIERLIGSGDHLSNGRLFVGFSLLLLLVSALGLALAALDRVTEDGLLGGISDTLWPSSLIGLVLMGVLPLLVGLGICIVPLQVGSVSVSFPRAAALSLWAWLIGALLFVTSVVLDGGVGGVHAEFTRMGNLSLGLMMAAIALGAACVATTVFSHRPVGMRLARVPFFSWSMLVAAPVWILSLGSAAAHVFLGHIASSDATGIAAAYDSGIAWLLHAPAVYMLAIPVLGITGDAVAHLTGRRLAPYGAFQGAIAAFGVLSFGAWAQTPRAVQTVIWAGVVVLAALPVLAMAGGVADAARRGKPKLAASLGALVLAHLLVLGGVLAAALEAVDTIGSGQLWNLDTGSLRSAQALFLIAAATLGALGGTFHWSERLFGSPAGEGPARGGSLAVLLGGGLAATVLVVQAIAAADGRDGLPDGLLYALVAAGAALLALGVLGGLASGLGAARQGHEGGPSGDGATEGLTLEWSTAGDPVAVRSPYPLLDLRDGGASDEESN
jgi:hypothetical protein